jgi:hypothetical protein
MTQLKESSAEQRRHPRIEILDNLEVRDVGSGKPIGQLANISVEGLMVISPGPLSTGRSYRLSIPLSAEGVTDTRIEVTAESLWCEDTNASGAYWTGFHITTISARDQAILDKLAGY